MAQRNPIHPKYEGRPLAVITGASSGSGYELAQVFAKNNFDLVVTAEDAGIVEAAEAFRAFGGEVHHIQTNLAAFKGVDAFIENIRSLNRPIDTAVFNTSAGTSGEFAQITTEEDLHLIQLNVVSTVHLAKHIVRTMIPQNHGRLLFTSSIATEMPGPYHAVYAASKAFIQTFAEALRFELKEKNITVSAAGLDKTADPTAVAQEGFDTLMASKDYVKRKPGSALKNELF